jgi:hypothetical protein
MPDVVLTGLPRSGSTLTCHLLNRCADTVALHEPIPMGDLARDYSGEGLLGQIELFFSQTRQSLLRDRRATSKTVAGKVPDNTFGEARGNEDQLRRSLASHGEVHFADKELTPDFTLAVKHNAGFAAMLERLTTRFPCYGIIRNPLAVLASWNSVNLPVQQGHVPVGEQIDPQLQSALAGISDRTERQFYILAWFFERFARLLPRERIFRYEEIVSSGGRALAPVTSGAASLQEALQSKNANSAYDSAVMRALGEKLLTRDGAYWEFYSKESVEAMIGLLPAQG